MTIAIVTLASQPGSSYVSGRFQNDPRKDKETPADHEERTWRGRLHVCDGEVFIPPTAFKNCLAEAAKYLSFQIPGKGKATYTKHFEAGVSVHEPVMLGVKAADVKPLDLFVPSDGKRGGTKRVMKKFPEIPSWKATVNFLVLDDEVITKDVFVRHLKEAGNFIGVGSFRPRNNGYHGRFQVLNLKWEPVEV